MKRLDPGVLFARIAGDVPANLHKHLVVTGSLAAAYHFQAQLEGRGVSTKDADLVVHPAGDVGSCQKMADKLLGVGWTRTDECFARESLDPEEELRAIRLYPPASRDYFIEFLNVPARGQTEAIRWIKVQLDDGWYGLPTFRFMGLTIHDRLLSEAGIEYAAPEMMTLANLLSHPRIGTERIQSAGMRGTLRSAKDLGRVLALARLAGLDEMERWIGPWTSAMQACFADEWRQLARNAGSGIRELLADQAALDEACQTTEVGLLNGKSVTSEMLAATGQRLLQAAIEPLESAAKK